MGYVSMFEDIVDRFTRELAKWSDSHEGTTLPSREERRRITGLINEANRKLAEVHCALDLATDPTLELADEARRMRKENSVLRERLDTLEDQIKTCRQTLRKEQAAHSSAELRVDKLELENRELDHKLASLTDLVVVSVPQVFDRFMQEYCPDD